jgi:hypothetical protein
MSDDQRWYIKVDGIRYEGEICEIDPQPVNCKIAIWTLKTWDSSGSIQIELSAPRTRFRKVDAIASFRESKPPERKIL